MTVTDSRIKKLEQEYIKKMSRYCREPMGPGAGEVCFLKPGHDGYHRNAVLEIRGLPWYSTRTGWRG